MAIANANGVKGTTFTTYGPCPPPAQDCFVDGPVSLDVMLSWHRAWAAYVTGIGPAQRPGSDAPPIAFGRQIFTEDEYRHMADVRSVFRGAETAAVLALGVLAFRLIRAGSWRSYGPGYGPAEALGMSFSRTEARPSVSTYSRAG